MEVKQWQEERREDNNNNTVHSTTTPTTPITQPLKPHLHTHTHHTHHPPTHTVPSSNGVERREGGWVSDMTSQGKVPQVSVLNPQDVLNGRRGQRLESDQLNDDLDSSSSDMDVNDDNDDWDDLCTTDSEDDDELTDIDG
jgi:hypothetical protein